MVSNFPNKRLRVKMCNMLVLWVVMTLTTSVFSLKKEELVHPSLLLTMYLISLPKFPSHDLLGWVFYEEQLKQYNSVLYKFPKKKPLIEVSY